MNKLLAIVLCVFGLVAAADRGASAQDLAITHARIITGTGEVIESGSIVVRSGRIASISAGGNAAGMKTVIDARGMTAMPGFIDAHRHIIQGNADQWLQTQAAQRMREFLDAGYTTILAGGGPAEGNLELARRIESGRLTGPRIIPAAQVNLNTTTPDQARAELRRLAAMGIMFIGEESISPRPPTPQQLDNLKALNDEAQKAGVHVVVHAVSPQAMMAAVDAGTKYLVHTPHFGWVTDEEARKVAAAGVKELSTTAFGVPVFGVFADDNTPRFRDGKPWPDAILDGEGRGREAGYKAVNARTMFDAGVVYGYGTDTTYAPKAGLAQELRTLNLMFSPRDIIKIMGPNTASFIEMSDQLGTLAPGKLADIVLLDGNPLDGYWNLLNTRVVVKGGVIVADHR